MRFAHSFPLLCAALVLAGCQSSNTIAITHETAAQEQRKPRSEPIFFNGKTYKLDFSFNGAANAYDMRVSGMGPKQQKDAVQLATSSLRYFACTDRQSSQAAGDARYEGGVWLVPARCV